MTSLLIVLVIVSGFGRLVAVFFASMELNNSAAVCSYFFLWELYVIRWLYRNIPLSWQTFKEK